MATVIRSLNGNFKERGLGFYIPISKTDLLNWNMFGDNALNSVKNWAPDAESGVPLNTSLASYGDGFFNRLNFDSNQVMLDIANKGCTIVVFGNAVSSPQYQTGNGVSILSGSHHYRYSPELQYAYIVMSLDGHDNNVYNFGFNISAFPASGSGNGSQFGLYMDIRNIDANMSSKINMFTGRYNPSSKKVSCLVKNANVSKQQYSELIQIDKVIESRYNESLQFRYTDINKVETNKFGGLIVFNRHLSDVELQLIYNWGKMYFDKRGLIGL